MSKPSYVLIQPVAWMNENGYGISFIATTERWTSVEVAKEKGFEIFGSDDFNIGRISKNRLVAMMWMDKVMDYTPGQLEEIQKKAGIR